MAISSCFLTTERQDSLFETIQYDFTSYLFQSGGRIGENGEAKRTLFNEFKVYFTPNLAQTQQIKTKFAQLYPSQHPSRKLLTAYYVDEKIALVAAMIFLSIAIGSALAPAFVTGLTLIPLYIMLGSLLPFSFALLGITINQRLRWKIYREACHSLKNN